MTTEEKLDDATKRLARYIKNEAAMKMCLQNIGWPRRGSREEMWDVYKIAGYARNIYEALFGSVYEQE